ncbi:unnamed protein product [Dicrocoelium dendriticum]|nr:unnamed protein product [Dicrocoelium dendriticum]
MQSFTEGCNRRSSPHMFNWSLLFLLLILHYPEVAQLKSGSSVYKGQTTCCIRGRGICEVLSISLKEVGRVCFSVIHNLSYLGTNGFLIEQNVSVPRGIYSIVALKVDLSLGSGTHLTARVVYAAINVRMNCLRATQPCLPQRYLLMESECSTDMDKLVKLDLFLIPQSRRFPDTYLYELVDEGYAYSNFYDRSTFSASPIRCNRYWLHECNHHAKFNHLLMDSHENLDRVYIADDDELPYKLNSKVLDQFPNVIVTKRMIDREMDTCFITLELRNRAISKEESLKSSLANCSRHHPEWHVLRSARHNYPLRLEIIKMATEWFLYAKREYIHYQIMQKYFDDMQLVHPGTPDISFLNRRDENRIHMGRIVTRLQVFADIIEVIHAPWKPPINYYRENLPV